jgi:membrane-associated phospholipid phosphatase
MLRNVTIYALTRLKILTTASIIILISPSLITAQSPYRCDWSTDGWIVGAGGAIGISAFFISQSVTPLTVSEIDRLTPRDVNAFDRAATYHYSKSLSQVSDVLVGLNAAAGMLLLLDCNIRNDWRTLGIMSIETALMATALPMLIKGQVQRIRPYVYNPDVPLNIKTRKEAKGSFFSGHSTVAFASAVFISSVYSDYFPHSKWKTSIWTGSLLLASTIGFLRFESGKHFPTDILTGALVGSTIGYVIPVLHRPANRNLEISPVTGARTLMMDVQFRF